VPVRRSRSSVPVIVPAAMTAAMVRVVSMAAMVGGARETFVNGR
jgi:hypothetical protein